MPSACVVGALRFSNLANRAVPGTRVTLVGVYSIFQGSNRSGKVRPRPSVLLSSVTVPRPFA